MEEQKIMAYREEHGVGIIEFDQPDSKVNLLTALAMQRLAVILEEVKRKANLKAVLIVSKKKDVFIAGADIKEIEGIRESEEGELKSKTGQEILNTLEDLRMPSVAVIDGVALGGGCELTLACTYRIATFNEKVKIGLPEVKLGIIPGFGGTYRLPRLVGLSLGLQMILAGKVVSSQEALKIGLVDQLYPQAGLLLQVRKFVEDISLLKEKKKIFRSPKKNVAQFLLEKTFIGQAVLFSSARKMTLKSTKGFYPAPLKAIDVVAKAQHLNREKALNLEAKVFGRLAVTDISKNLVKLFYLTERFKKLVPPGAEHVKPGEIRKCAVLGAGIMGGGIAQLLSSKGIWVRLKDINYDAIAKGLKAAYKIYQQEMERRRLKKHELDLKMAHITGTLDYSGFKNADMVIEAIIESMDIKKKVFKELSSAVSPIAVLCSNTSALSITEMAKQTNDPSKVVGLHFFNPVHRMPLIEIIKTEFTSLETLAAASHLVKRLDKIPILVKDSCGFLVNRILLGYINEAGRILEEGGKIEDIDDVMIRFGMPMGPFALADEVGLDVGFKVLKILHEGLGERFKPQSIFQKVYEDGLLGKKSGKGFYVHGKKHAPNQAVYSMIKAAGLKQANKEESLERMLYIMINEAARCLEEGMIDGPDVVDIGMIMGTGFPPFRGGLLRYADSVGIEDVVDTLNSFEDKCQSDRFKPCRFLLQLKEKKEKFYKV